eukprot:tig00001368_g8407.t1
MAGRTLLHTGGYERIHYAHANLAAIAVPGLMVAGVFLATFMRRQRWWLKAHIAIQTLAVILQFIAAILLLRDGIGHRNSHTVLGIFVVVLSGGVAFLGASSLWRRHVGLGALHRWAGRLLLVLGITQVALGVDLLFAARSPEPAAVYGLYLAWVFLAGGGVLAEWLLRISAFLFRSELQRKAP